MSSYERSFVWTAWGAALLRNTPQVFGIPRPGENRPIPFSALNTRRVFLKLLLLSSCLNSCQSPVKRRSCNKSRVIRTVFENCLKKSWKFGIFVWFGFVIFAEISTFFGLWKTFENFDDCFDEIDTFQSFKKFYNNQKKWKSQFFDNSFSSFICWLFW